ncbi:MAG: HD domain-containing protein [Clostridia bacterium]|nr:HD domain-containing protein [Clostridia bacterium]
MNILNDEQTRELRRITEQAEELYSPYACKNAQYVRERESRYDDEAVRSQFAVDADKIIHSPFFNRGSDKTQVFSFFKNDDITRRASHVQLVSRIARSIGRALRLNCDLIEAIAIGHDIGHTPFGHKGEKYLNELYNGNTGRYFNHNVHSVRVLQVISRSNLTLQTADGIICHCGEKVNEEYFPAVLGTYSDFKATFENCYTDETAVGRLHPATLEGCVVRLSDMIAYIGKDRQDAGRLKMRLNYSDTVIGKSNSEIISAVTSDVIANSMGKPYLSVSKDVFDALVSSQRENNLKIYQCEEVTSQYDKVVKPMMEKLYTRFLKELKAGDGNSLIYKNYLNDYIVGKNYETYYKTEGNVYREDDIVSDFIASMTDDYFLEAFAYLFPDDGLNSLVKRVDYFDKRFI